MNIQFKEGDTFDNIVRRFYLKDSRDNEISEEEYNRLRNILQEENSQDGRRIRYGDEIFLPNIEGFRVQYPIWINNIHELGWYSHVIVDRVNRDNLSGLLMLVDPVRVLEELGFEFSEEAKEQIYKSVIGATKSQRDQYEYIKEQRKVNGFNSVRLRHKNERRTPKARNSLTYQNDSNPIGDFDTVIDIKESILYDTARIAYDEGVIPHRFPSVGDLGKEIIIGRPTVIDLDTATANAVKLHIPFALDHQDGPKKGTIEAEFGVKIHEEKEKPSYLCVDFKDNKSLNISSSQLSSNQIGAIETLAPILLKSYKLPLSPIIKELDKSNIGIVDLDYKIHKFSDPQKADSAALCINLKPNNNAGNIKNVKQFVEKDWALGVNQRLLKQKFNDWWWDKNSSKYHRLDQDKLDKIEDLKKQNKLDEIFDSNGDIYVGGVDFSVQNGYIDFSVDVTAEDQVLWFDFDIDVSGKIKLEVDKNSKFMLITVYDVDTSISWWSKFLVALFFTFVGLVVGFILGAIIGGLIGGITSVAIGAAVGMSIGGVSGFLITGVILPAIAEAAAADSLNKLTKKPVIKLDYEWQIPETNLVFKVTGDSISLSPGEALIHGLLTLPPLHKSTIELSTVTVSKKTSVDLPWEPMSAEQKQKLGKSPYYLVDSSTTCNIIPKDMMEKPLVKNEWIFNGKKVPGDGTKATIIIQPKLDYMLKKTGYADSSPDQQFKVETVSCIKITKTIQVTNSNGTKANPHVVVEVIPGNVIQFSDKNTLKVKSEDILGNKAEKEVEIEATILGDGLADWWAKNKHKYEQKLHPDDLLKKEWENMVQVPEILTLDTLRLVHISPLALNNLEKTIEIKTITSQIQP
jgi:hypothetical protein